MPGVGIKVDIRGARQVANLMRRVRGLVEDNRQELHLRWGIQTLNWVTRNFAAEGAMTGAPWRKLSPNTIAGRRKGSSRVLQDTGGLKNSFTLNATSTEVAVGTEKQIALYHEEGTGTYGKRGSAYPIVPKNPGGVLAFRMAEGGSRVKASFSSIATQRTYKKGQMITFAKSVMHPGVPIRRMLPKRGEILPTILKTTINYLNELKQRGS